MVFKIFLFCALAATSLAAGNHQGGSSQTENTDSVYAPFVATPLEEKLEEKNILETGQNFFFSPFPLALTECLTEFLDTGKPSFENVTDTLLPFMSLVLGAVRFRESADGSCKKDVFAQKSKLLKAYGIQSFDAEKEPFHSVQDLLSRDVAQGTQGRIHGFGEELSYDSSRYALAYSALYCDVQWEEPFRKKELCRFTCADNASILALFMTDTRYIFFKKNNVETVLLMPLKEMEKNFDTPSAEIFWIARKPIDKKDQKSFHPSWLEDLEKKRALLRIPALKEKHTHKTENTLHKVIYEQDELGARVAQASARSSKDCSRAEEVFLDAPHTISLVVKTPDKHYLEIVSGYIGTLSTEASSRLEDDYAQESMPTNLTMEEMEQVVAAKLSANLATALTVARL